jgi:hypothetical protein
MFTDKRKVSEVSHHVVEQEAGANFDSVFVS